MTGGALLYFAEDGTYLVPADGGERRLLSPTHDLSVLMRVSTPGAGGMRVYLQRSVDRKSWLCGATFGELQHGMVSAPCGSGGLVPSYARFLCDIMDGSGEAAARLTVAVYPDDSAPDRTDSDRGDDR